MVLTDISAAFILGLLTPLTAVCVLPLYPGFLSYLASKMSAKNTKLRPFLLGVIVTCGVLLFMILLGLIFTTFLQVSLTRVIGIVSPVAFVILLVISLLLIFNVDAGKFLPKFSAPVAKNPLFSAFLFGFFFGAIVIPCNPLFIAALFTRAISAMDFFANMLNFLFFGIGISFPLLALSAISGASSSIVIDFLTRNKRIINFVAGIIMLIISLYYLIFVFNVI